jgi:hypothetical protein
MPDPKMVSSWRWKMSPIDLQLVEARIGILLRARGYDCSSHPPVRMTAAMERRLCRQDWYGRMRFRLRRYGLSLFCQDYLARRLPFPRFRRAVRMRINAMAPPQITSAGFVAVPW